MSSNLAEKPAETRNKGGRPRGKQTLEALNARRQRQFSKALDRYQRKPVKELEAIAANLSELSAIEAMAVQTLLRAAKSGGTMPMVIALQAKISDVNTKSSTRNGQTIKAAPPPKPEKTRGTEVDESLPDPGEFAT